MESTAEFNLNNLSVSIEKKNNDPNIPESPVGNNLTNSPSMIITDETSTECNILADITQELGIPILLENTHDHVKKDNVLTDEEKENILENIMPVKRRKDITSINKQSYADCRDGY